MNVSPFSFDVTAPVGHPLCGGWIPPARQIIDPQFGHGIVIDPGDNAPIVLLAVDWCWILSAAHEAWREALADALNTLPSRVAIHCVHQHDAPMAAPDADRILAREKIPLRTLDIDFFKERLKRSAAAAQAAMAKPRRVTHVGTGQAKVEQVACNRRVVGPSGRVELWRGSSCTNAELRAAPEGLIDPYLKCISFWDEERPVAALHYYATHPMSYYGDGGVSSDFVGLARERLRKEQPEVAHIYFTGCAGNVAAGKYNDGSHEMRPVLMRRMYDGMKAAFASTQRRRFGEITWRTESVHLPMSEEFTRAHFEKCMRGETANTVDKVKGAMGIAWWDRHDAGRKIDIARLRIDNIAVLHLPGEPFVEFQLAAQKMAAEAPNGEPLAPHLESVRANPFVAVAGYGDGGPAYIPTAAAYPQGGYEVTMAWVGAKAEAMLLEAMRQLIRR